MMSKPSLVTVLKCLLTSTVLLSTLSCAAQNKLSNKGRAGKSVFSCPIRYKWMENSSEAKKKLTSPLKVIIWGGLGDEYSLVSYKTELLSGNSDKIELPAFNDSIGKYHITSAFFGDSTSDKIDTLGFLSTGTLAVINDDNNDGAFGFQDDAIYGFSTEHLLVYISNSKVLEFVDYYNNKTNGESCRSSYWSDLKVGYNLVTFTKAADGCSFDGFKRVDESTSTIELKVIDSVRGVDMPNWMYIFHSLICGIKCSSTPINEE